MTMVMMMAVMVSRRWTTVPTVASASTPTGFAPTSIPTISATATLFETSHVVTRRRRSGLVPLADLGQKGPLVNHHVFDLFDDECLLLLRLDSDETVLAWEPCLLVFDDFDIQRLESALLEHNFVNKLLFRAFRKTADENAEDRFIWIFVVCGLVGVFVVLFVWIRGWTRPRTRGWSWTGHRTWARATATQWAFWSTVLRRVWIVVIIAVVGIVDRVFWLSWFGWSWCSLWLFVKFWAFWIRRDVFVARVVYGRIVLVCWNDNIAIVGVTARATHSINIFMRKDSE